MISPLVVEVKKPQLLTLAVLSSAARNPLASFNASSLAQKCRKNSRGCSSSMWLWTAVTSMPFARNAFDHGIYFVASQNKITGDSGLAATGRLEVDGNSHAHRSHRSNLHSVFRNRIPPRHIELIDPAVGLSFDAAKLVELPGIKVDAGRRSGSPGC